MKPLGNAQVTGGRREGIGFAAPSLETTLRAVPRFVAEAQRIPSGSVINVAHVEDVAIGRRLAAIDALCAAGLRPRPIISTRRIRSRGELRQLLDELLGQRGLKQVLVVGGDPDTAAGPYATALDLLRSSELATAGLEGIMLPGFPDSHPSLRGPALLDLLAHKAEAVQALGAAAEITTQLCLDPHRVLEWIAEARNRGITVPIRVGVPAPSSVEQLARFAALCRVPMTDRDIDEQGWLGANGRTDPGAFLTTLGAGLAPELGPVGLHLYPLGNLPGALGWVASVSGG